MTEDNERKRMAKSWKKRPISEAAKWRKPRLQQFDTIEDWELFLYCQGIQTDSMELNQLCKKLSYIQTDEL